LFKLTSNSPPPLVSFSLPLSLLQVTPLAGSSSTFLLYGLLPANTIQGSDIGDLGRHADTNAARHVVSTLSHDIGAAGNTASGTAVGTFSAAVKYTQEIQYRSKRRLCLTEQQLKGLQSTGFQSAGMPHGLPVGGGVSERPNIVATIQSLSGIYEWDYTGTSQGATSPGQLREIYPGKYGTGLNTSELSMLGTLGAGISKWCVRTMVNFVYRFLQFHVALEENAAGTRLGRMRVHTRIKLPGLIGLYHSDWRILSVFELDGSLKYNNNCAMHHAHVLRLDARQHSDTRVLEPAASGEALVEFMTWSFPSSCLLKDASPLSFPSGQSRAVTAGPNQSAASLIRCVQISFTESVLALPLHSAYSVFIVQFLCPVLCPVLFPVLEIDSLGSEIQQHPLKRARIRLKH